MWVRGYLCTCIIEVAAENNDSHMKDETATFKALFRESITG